MKSLLKLLPAATLAMGLALSAAPAMAQQPAAPKASPAAIAAAKEILTIKNAAGMYAGAVPGMVEKAKIALTQQNLNYQKDSTRLRRSSPSSSPAVRTKSARAWRRSMPASSPSRN